MSVISYLFEYIIVRDTMLDIPDKLDSVLHSHADRGIAAEVLAVLNSTPATCAAEVSQTVGCSYVTAEKHLAKITAGLAIEKRIGKVQRVFIAKRMASAHRRDPRMIPSVEVRHLRPWRKP